MTNKRAIELLHRISDSQFDGPHGDERREALSMAVRALSGDGDTISRKMAIDAVNQAYTNTETVNNRPVNNYERELYFRIRGELSKLPSAQPQRMKGRWIHDGYDNPHGVDWMHCSVCGRREPHVPAAMTNFCPSCGADMRGESDE